MIREVLQKSGKMKKEQSVVFIGISSYDFLNKNFLKRPFVW